MDDNHVKHMKRCYELAISAGKKGYDTQTVSFRKDTSWSGWMKPLLNSIRFPAVRM